MREIAQNAVKFIDRAVKKQEVYDTLPAYMDFRLAVITGYFRDIKDK